MLKVLPLIFVFCLFLCACGNQPAVATDPTSGEPVATDPSTGEIITDTTPQESENDPDSLFTLPEDMQGLTLPFVEFEYEPVITPVPTEPANPTEPAVTEPTEATPVDTTPEEGIPETLPFQEFN